MQIEIINGTLHQWDTGRQVQVTLDEGTTLREVRFSHHRSPSPIRVAPEAGNVADIPDELLRHSGMLWVTAIVVDAYGKPQTHSRCVCTECAVRPDDYNAGGGSGGDKLYTVRCVIAPDEDRITSDITYAEVLAIYQSGRVPNVLYVERSVDEDGNESAGGTHAITSRITMSENGDGVMCLQGVNGVMIFFYPDGTIEIG